MTGIVSYGFYVPKYRIKTSDIADHWDKCGDKVEQSLQVFEKAVASKDEDILTMAYEASIMALGDFPVNKTDIGAVFIGSETFPYAVNPSSTALAEWLDIGNDYLAYDTQFACKAATGALISAFALIKAGEIKNALVCGSDKANAKPQDALEYSAGSGANAWILGNDHVMAEIIGWHSYSSDTPDFWRRAKADNPSHAGRFTGAPAYYHHIMESSKRVLDKTHHSPEDFAYAVFHMPNGRFPLDVGKKLGFTKEQIETSYVVPQLGNSYSASALMGLAAVFEKAQPGDKVFFASYGSGAGSDSLIFNVTEEIEKQRKPFQKLIQSKSYINYGQYLQFMNMI